MKKTFFTFCLLALTTFSFGQYSEALPNFTNNPLLYNPAYAGSAGSFDASIRHAYNSSLLFSSGNHFSLLSLSAPIGDGTWSIGGNLMHDTGIFSNFSEIATGTAYRKTLKNDSKLLFGAMVSLERHTIDYNSQLSSSLEARIYRPEIGLGILYQTKFVYFSMAMPDLLGLGFSYENSNGDIFEGSSNSDLYLQTGLNLQAFNNKLQLLPSLAYQKTFNYPQTLIISSFNKIHLGGSLVLLEKVWLSSHYSFQGYDNNWREDYKTIKIGVGLALDYGFRVNAEFEWLAGEGFGREPLGGIMLGYRFSKESEKTYLGRRHFF